MIIRRMQAEDLAVVSQIDGLSFNLPWPPDAFEIELNNPISRCWVAEVESTDKFGMNDLPGDSHGLVPGSVRCIGMLVIWRVLDEAHIATIAVHPDFRGQGVGKQLMQTCMQSAYAEGARIYHLEVRAGNQAAQKMYLDLGFEIVGRRPRYYHENGEDALLMTLDLTRSNPVNHRLDFLLESHDAQHFAQHFAQHPERTRKPDTDRQ